MMVLVVNGSLDSLIHSWVRVRILTWSTGALNVVWDNDL